MPAGKQPFVQIFNGIALCNYTRPDGHDVSVRLAALPGEQGGGPDLETYFNREARHAVDVVRIVAARKLEPGDAYIQTRYDWDSPPVWAEPKAVQERSYILHDIDPVTGLFRPEVLGADQFEELYTPAEGPALLPPRAVPPGFGYTAQAKAAGYYDGHYDSFEAWAADEARAPTGETSDYALNAHFGPLIAKPEFKPYVLRKERRILGLVVPDDISVSIAGHDFALARHSAIMRIAQETADHTVYNVSMPDTARLCLRKT